MGIILDILKEIPLSAVLRERLAGTEAKMATLEKENEDLQAKVDVLETENGQLRLQLHEVQKQQQVDGDVCPYCRQPKGQLLNLRPDPTFGHLGVKVGDYKCSHCGKEYERQHQP